MNRISVFCCGVQKGGTTSLFSYFSGHPALQTPIRKELHIFDDETIDWSQPIDHRVENFFERPPSTDQIRFDITPIYIFWPNAIQRIYQYNPDAKLICLFRDPFERAFSQWCMEYARGDETIVFSDAIRDGRARINEVIGSEFALRHYSYIERGFYGDQVDRLLSIFPRDQILFLRSDALNRQPVDSLAKVSQFLGVGAFHDTTAKRDNKRAAIDYPSSPSQDDMDVAADIFANDLERFAELTGLDISDWPTMQRAKGR